MYVTSISSHHVFIREDKDLVDVFVLELLVVVINSLRISHTQRDTSGKTVSFCLYDLTG